MGLAGARGRGHPPHCFAARGDWGSRSGRALGRHWPTHLMCRPSCCTPRAGSSDTPSTPAWWAPRRHTPPGPQRGICGQERRDQVLRSWSTAHPPPGPVVSAPLYSHLPEHSAQDLSSRDCTVSLLCTPRPQPPCRCPSFLGTLPFCICSHILPGQLARP